MSEELDINKVAAEFVTQNLERFYDSGKGVLKGAADAVRLRLRKSYRDYIVCVAERYSKAKSFFIRNEPTYLYDFYVPLGVSSKKGKLEAASIEGIATINRFAIITGGGGSGKSILMRHLLLDTIKSGKRVPVFIELRELNHSDQSLIELVYSTLHLNHLKLDSDYIEKAISAGHFAFFFDGFDEIGRSLRKKVRQQIQDLAKSHDQNTFVVSSRPDDEFAGWAGFSVFSIDALTLDKACSLVEALPFDVDLKMKFLKDLRANLFEKHKSFLSNPLLLSIMLLTYGESADIPNKINIFYNQAYEALFQRHDALKGGFQRDRSTTLDIQDFARVFSAFAVLTYDKRAFQFSRTDAIDFLQKSKPLTNLNFNSEDYLTDALQSVCLLTEEGLLVVFSHRSFQEYFVARFIANSIPEVQRKLINKYGKNLSDSVMKLLYEMNPELVERLFILPMIERILQMIGAKRKIGITHLLRFLKNQFTALLIERDGMLVELNSATQFFGSAIEFIRETCGQLVGWQRTREEQYGIEVRKLWSKYSTGERQITVPVSALTTRNPLLRDIAKSQCYFFSISRLQSLFDVKKVLLDKHRRSDKSIEELLDE